MDDKLFRQLMVSAKAAKNHNMASDFIRIVPRRKTISTYGGTHKQQSGALRAHEEWATKSTLDRHPMTVLRVGVLSVTQLSLEAYRVQLVAVGPDGGTVLRRFTAHAKLGTENTPEGYASIHVAVSLEGEHSGYAHLGSEEAEDLLATKIRKVFGNARLELKCMRQLVYKLFWAIENREPQ